MTNVLEGVDAHLILGRKAHKEAQEASAEWKKLNDDFMDLARRMGWTRDPLNLAKIKEENIGLRDALNTWSFWEREAKRHADAIAMELNAMELHRRLEPLLPGRPPEEEMHGDRCKCPFTRWHRSTYSVSSGV